MDEQEERFEFKNTYLHIIYFVFYLFEWGGLSSFLYDDIGYPRYGVTVIHYLLVTLVVGHPILYFQVFIGQYTRRGCLFLGAMLPIFQGLGYSMIILSLAKTVFQFYYTEKVLYYFFVSITNFKPQPWMECYKHAFNYNQTNLKFIEVVRFILHAMLLYCSLLIALSRSIKNFEFALRAAMSFGIVAMASILIVVSTRDGAPFGFRRFFTQITYKSLSHSSTWRSAFHRVIDGLRLPEGGQILFGSFIPVNDVAAHRATFLTSTFIIVILFSLMYYHLFKGVLIYTLGLGLRGLGLTNEEAATFITIPTVLGMQASAYLYCSFYFFVMVLLSFMSMAVRIIAIEHVISDLLHDLKFTKNKQYEFYLYIRFALCTFVLAMSFVIIFSISNNGLHILKHSANVLGALISVGQIIIVFTYGYQRLVDDIIFLRKIEVWPALRIFSTLTFVAGIMIIYMEWGTKRLHEFQTGFRAALFGLAIAPIFICSIIQIFIHVKKKNLIGVLRPTDEFGPPDVEQRILRILYNPRLAMRSRRQEEICQHVCLLKNEGFYIALREELELLIRFTQELQSITTEGISYEGIIEELKHHQKLLRKRIKMA